MEIPVCSHTSPCFTALPLDVTAGRFQTGCRKNWLSMPNHSISYDLLYESPAVDLKVTSIKECF